MIQNLYHNYNYIESLTFLNYGFLHFIKKKIFSMIQNSFMLLYSHIKYVLYKYKLREVKPHNLKRHLIIHII